MNLERAAGIRKGGRWHPRRAAGTAGTASQRTDHVEEAGWIEDRVTISARARAMYQKSGTALVGDRPWQVLSYEIRRHLIPATCKDDPLAS